MAPVSATSFFGGGTASSLFAATVSKGPTSAQENARVIISAQKREINQIRGYKPILNPAEKLELSEIKKKIENIQVKANAGTVRSDELEDRTELLLEADRIIGKPIAKTGDEIDDKLAEYAGALEKLLEPKLSPSAQQRVDMLKRIKTTLESAVDANPENATIRAQFQNVSRQLAAQNPSRPISALSIAEKRAYDDLAELINDTAGVSIQLSSKDTLRVSTLESSILDLQSQLGEDPTQLPSAQSVNRAYVRLA